MNGEYAKPKEMKRSDIYKAIRNKASELTYLKSKDLQKGQFQKEKDTYPLPLPALLVEFSDFRFKSQLEHTQIGEGIVSLFLYLNLVTDSFKGAEREDETIEILDRFDDLFQTFEGLSIPGLLSPLVRVTEFKPQYGNRYIMFRIDFSTSVDDAKTIVRQTAEKPQPDIAAKFKFK